MIRIRAIAVAGLAVIAIWYCVAPRPPDGAGRDARTATAPPNDARRGAPNAISSPSRPPPATTRSGDPSPIDAAKSAAEGRTEAPDRPASPPRASLLDNYLRATRYPPTSRPLTPANEDLIHPNQRHDRKAASEQDPEVTFLLTADRYRVNGTEALTATLQAWRNDVPVAPEILSAGLVAVEPTIGTVIPVTFQIVDQVGMATIVPSAIIDGPHAMIVALQVTFTVGESTDSAAINFQYTPPRSVPAHFTGRFGDRVVDGSLVIDAGVEVLQPGYFVIDANLWAGDEPVAWTRFKGQLDGGPATVALRFFGKAIRSRGFPGPYRIGELRGARFDEGRQPDMDHMTSVRSAYETTAYPLDVFSDADWTSPIKERKIEALRRATLDPSQPPVTETIDPSAPPDDEPTTEPPPAGGGVPGPSSADR